MTTTLHPSPADRRWSVPELALLVVVMILLIGSFTNAANWGYEFGGSPVKPRDFNLIFGLLALVLLPFNRPRFCIPSLALISIPLVRLLDAAFLRRYTDVDLGHSAYVMMLAGFLLVTIAAVFSLSAAKGLRIAVWVASGSIVMNSVMNLYEYLGFASFTRIPGRMSGFHIDPNHSPIIICLMLGILFTVNKRYGWNLIMVAVSGVGIALTMSRSGMAVFAVMIGIYVLLHFREHLAAMLTLAVVGVPLLVIGIGIMGANSTRQGLGKNEDTAGRMEAIFNGDFSKLKSSERAKDLADGWEAVTLKPVTGHGTGAGELKWQPHNMLVSQWIDLGLPGLLHYLGALLVLSVASMLKRFRGGFCLIPIWLFIPCSQVLMDVAAYWFAAAVCCGVLFSKQYAIRLRHGRPEERTTAPLPDGLTST